MSAHTTMILFVTLLIVTTGGVMVFYEITQNTQQKVTATNSEEKAAGAEDIVLVNAIGMNITNETITTARFQIRYEGDEPLALNDTFIQLKTDRNVADLHYRDGIPERNEQNGYYTN